MHPEYQRKKVATGLVAKAAEISIVKKIEALSVHTSVENMKMIAFLKRNEFKVFKRIPDFYGKGKAALRYRKP